MNQDSSTPPFPSASSSVPPTDIRRPLFGLDRLGLLVAATATCIFCFFLIDQPLTLELYHQVPAGSRLGDFFNHITNVGESTNYLILFAVGALVSFLFIDSARSRAAMQLPDAPTNPLARIVYRLQHAPITARLLLAFASVAGSGLVGDLIKVIIARYRPDMLTDHTPPLYGFAFFKHGYDYNSMPSGHSTTCGALFTLLSLYFPKGLPLWAVLTVFGAATRILVQAHYLSDVISGYTLGVLFTLVLHDLAKNHRFPAE